MFIGIFPSSKTVITGAVNWAEVYIISHTHTNTQMSETAVLLHSPKRGHTPPSTLNLKKSPDPAPLLGCYPLAVM